MELTLVCQIKHQQNAYVLRISVYTPTCFSPTGPSSGCVLLQNVRHNVHIQYTSIYNSMERGRNFTFVEMSVRAVRCSGGEST